ncbi:TatD family hydrolase [Paraburkholderia bengalensis]|uniref:TatD family hydrolase n=2 Tax=Paraburkholderia bengalensis TaxID=2747562 RepID=A0ABU8J2W4_9BURK
MHCHLDLYPDHAQLIAECDEERIATLAVTTTPKAWSRNAEMARKSTHVRVALGLHPQLVAEREAEIGLFERLLPESRFVGEIGLDAGPRFYGSLDAQERVFDRILRTCAEQGGKVLTVHSVRAVTKVLNHVEKKLPPDRGRVILHWFTGSASEARRAADMGCFFSVNSEMLKSPKHCALVERLPIDRIITETDGPFVHVEGSPARPRSVVSTTARLATALGKDRIQMSEQIIQNLMTLEASLF